MADRKLPQPIVKVDVRAHRRGGVRVGERGGAIEARWRGRKGGVPAGGGGRWAGRRQRELAGRDGVIRNGVGRLGF